MLCCYIVVFEELGIFILVECGCYGGYCLVVGFKFLLLMFSVEEILVVFFGLLVVCSFGLGESELVLESV